MTSTTRPTLVHKDLSLGPNRKIASWHLDHLAVAYVRQSTAQQALVHAESTRLQYGLVSRAQAYDWAAERLFACLSNFRRLVVRYERHALNYFGFVHLDCIVLLHRPSL